MRLDGAAFGSAVHIHFVLVFPGSPVGWAGREAVAGLDHEHPAPLTAVLYGLCGAQGLCLGAVRAVVHGQQITVPVPGQPEDRYLGAHLAGGEVQVAGNGDIVLVGQDAVDDIHGKVVVPARALGRCRLDGCFCIVVDDAAAGTPWQAQPTCLSAYATLGASQLERDILGAETQLPQTYELSDLSDLPSIANPVRSANGAVVGV